MNSFCNNKRRKSWAYVCIASGNQAYLLLRVICCAHACSVAVGQIMYAEITCSFINTHTNTHTCCFMYNTTDRYVFVPTLTTYKSPKLMLFCHGVHIYLDCPCLSFLAKPYTHMRTFLETGHCTLYDKASEEFLCFQM